MGSFWRYFKGLLEGFYTVSTGVLGSFTAENFHTSGCGVLGP